MKGHKLIATTFSVRQIHLSANNEFRQNMRDRIDPAKMVENEKRGIFRVLDIGKPKPKKFGPRVWEDRRYKIAAPPRERLMKPDQDWPSVWPGPRTFHPASVPLPVRQGFAHLKGQATPGKYANIELMKIPNFLHLTPPAIKRHCGAIKKFCTPWPKELDDVDVLEENYPLTELTSDYLNSSSSIRDFRSRVTTIQFKLSTLFLDHTSRDKFLRLIGAERYDEETDLVTITADRCPYRKQNSEYCDYLLKACYYESRNREPWEKEQLDFDQIEYQIQNESDEIEEKLAILLNEGENSKTLDDYKNSMLQKLNLKNEIPLASS